MNKLITFDTHSTLYEALPLACCFDYKLYKGNSYLLLSELYFAHRSSRGGVSV